MRSPQIKAAGASSLRRQVKAVVFATGFGVGGLLTGLVVTVIGMFALTFVAGLHAFSHVRFLFTGILSEVGYALFPIVLVARRPTLLPTSIPGLFTKPTKRHLLWMGGGLLTMLAGDYVVAFMESTLHASSAPNSVAVQATHHSSMLVFVALVAQALFIVGPCEELLFRGLIQTYLQEYLHPALAIILTGALFASAHAIAVSGSLSGIRNTLISLFALSLVLGVAYQRTNSLLVPIVIHGGYDAILFGILGTATLH